jgi:hypothetical protein
LNAVKDYEDYTLAFFETNEVLQVKPVFGGRNNLGLSIQTEKGIFFIKHILEKKDSENRYKREKSLLTFCARKHINCVPELLGYDDKKRLLLQNFLVGNTPNQITDEHVGCATRFILDLNGTEESERPSLPAIDALDSAYSEIYRIKKRCQSTIQLLTAKQGHEALIKVILGHLDDLEKQESRLANSLTSILNLALRGSASGHFLSPSDFGFHNSMESGNRLYFFDFEYSGIDSPVKLCFDFVMQPDYKLTQLQEKMFIDKLQPLLGFCFEDLSYDLRFLFAFKWLLIMSKRLDAGNPSSVSLDAIVEYSQTKLFPLL